MLGKLRLLICLTLFSALLSSQALAAMLCSDIFSDDRNLTTLQTLKDYEPEDSSRRYTYVDKVMAGQLEKWLNHNPAASPHLGYQFATSPAKGQIYAPMIALYLKALQVGISKDSIKSLWMDLGNGTYTMAIAIKSIEGDWYVFDPLLKGKRNSLRAWYTDFLKLPGAENADLLVHFMEAGQRPHDDRFNKKFLFSPSLAEHTVEILSHLKNEKFFAEKNEKLLAELPLLPKNADQRLATEAESKNLFSWISNHPIMSYKAMKPEVRDDYCYLRAMAVHLKALEMGVDKNNIKKIWAFGHFEIGREGAFWGFHVATAIRLESGEWQIHDPYFDRSMSVHEWHSKMKALDPYGLMQVALTKPEVMLPSIKEDSSLLDLADPLRSEPVGAAITQDFLKSFLRANQAAHGVATPAHLVKGYPRIQSRELLRILGISN